MAGKNQGGKSGGRKIKPPQAQGPKTVSKSGKKTTAEINVAGTVTTTTIRKDVQGRVREIERKVEQLKAVVEEIAPSKRNNNANQQRRRKNATQSGNSIINTIKNMLPIVLIFGMIGMGFTASIEVVSLSAENAGKRSENKICLCYDWVLASLADNLNNETCDFEFVANKFWQENDYFTDACGIGGEIIVRDNYDIINAELTRGYML